VTSPGSRRQGLRGRGQGNKREQRRANENLSFPVVALPARPVPASSQQPVCSCFPARFPVCLLAGKELCQVVGKQAAAATTNFFIARATPF
jgi:hypothetical protein